MEYVYDPAVVMAPVVWLPLAAFDPLHDPPAEQELGLFVADHAMVAVPPVVIELGVKDILTTGTAITVRVTDFALLPALLLQVNV